MSKQTPKYTFVLIHGWGGSEESLLPLSEELEKQLTIKRISVKKRVIELPGFGNTPLPREFTLEDYSTYVDRVINKFFDNGSQLVLIGHSFGGKLILNSASKKRYPPAKLVLIDISGLAPRNSLKKQLFLAISQISYPIQGLLNFLGLTRFSRFLRKAFYKFIVRARDYEKISDPVLKKSFLNVVNTHLSEEQVKNTSYPTLILWGEKDKVTPLWMGDKLHKLISQSNIVTFPEATHSLPLKQAKESAEAIIQYLEQ